MNSTRAVKFIHQQNLSVVSVSPQAAVTFSHLTAFDEVFNEVLVLLVDVGAFGDVKLHGGGGNGEKPSMEECRTKNIRQRVDRERPIIR